MSRGGGNPVCLNCDSSFKHKHFDFSTLPAGLDCPGCGYSLAIDEVPAWLKEKVSGIRIIIGVKSEHTREEKTEGTAIEGVFCICPGCGGALKVDGSERIVGCEFCKSNVYLPDGLWLRLYPVKKVRRWWIAIG